MKAGKPIVKTVTAYQPPNHMPTIYDRNLTQIKGERHARRPSSLAKKAGKRLFTEVSPADAISDPEDGWSDQEQEWPLEDREEDCGWAAGPIKREQPAFKGRTPGPTDRTLDEKSSPQELVATQIPLEFKQKWMRYTKAHAIAWRAERRDTWRKDDIERSMKDFWRHLKPETFDVWLAAKIRVSQFKPELPQKLLWDRNDNLFDAQLFSVLSFKQYQWLNRHASFADYGNDANQLERGTVGFDMHRKRRELVDDLSEIFGKAWDPHQHLDLDEACRDHKHQGKQRIRFKAAVHSGNLVDELNDCKTKYCMFFEEQQWLKKKDGEDDPNTVRSRLMRATRALHDEGARHPRARASPTLAPPARPSSPTERAVSHRPSLGRQRPLHGQLLHLARPRLRPRRRPGAAQGEGRVLRVDGVQGPRRPAAQAYREALQGAQQVQRRRRRRALRQEAEVLARPRRRVVHEVRVDGRAQGSRASTSCASGRTTSRSSRTATSSRRRAAARSTAAPMARRRATPSGHRSPSGTTTWRAAAAPTATTSSARSWRLRAAGASCAPASRASSSLSTSR